MVGYKIGDIIDDMNKHHQSIALCVCNKCGREKFIIKHSLDNHKGTSHRACGQFLKTKYPHFYRKWTGLKGRYKTTKGWTFQYLN